MIDAIKAYREAEQKLLDLRAQAFPPGCVVQVTQDDSRQQGVVSGSFNAPVDRLPVRLQDNVYWIPLESVIRLDNPREWDPWILQLKRIQKKRQKIEERWRDLAAREEAAQKRRR